jgi:hypothetical protein
MELSSHGLGNSLRGTKGLSKRPTFIRTEKLKPIYYSVLFYTIHSITSRTLLTMTLEAYG